MSSPGGTCRIRGFELLPGGSGSVIAYFPQTKQTTVLTTEMAALLPELRAFRELKDHVAKLASGRAGDAGAMAAFVEQLVANELLVSASALVAGGAAAPAQPISAVGVLTFRRDEMLRAAVSSYHAHFARHGRRPDLLVADDEPDAARARRSREGLEELRNELDRPIFYVGVEQKERLARALARRSGVAEDLVRFALFSREGLETIGANRNALGLLSAGRLLFCADDDTSCELFASPEASPGLTIGDDRDPTSFWFFKSREEALAKGGERVAQDLLSAHEALLGLTVRDAAAAFAARGELVLGETCDHLLEGWERGVGQVRVTFGGVLGDSGMHSGILLRQLRGGSRQRLVASEAAYVQGCTTREVLRVAPTYTVTHGPPCMSTTAGIDYRVLAPPFFPVGRNEDGVFGATLRAVSPLDALGHIPFAIVHAAAPNRAYADFLLAAKRPRFSDILVALMSTARLGAEREERRVLALGRHLQDVAGGSAAAFVDASCACLLPIFSCRLQELEGAHAEHRGSPDYWARDLLRLRVAIADSLMSEPYWLPSDFSQGRSPDEILALTQRLVFRFGQLLEAWPALFRAAKELVDGGAGLKELLQRD